MRSYKIDLVVISLLMTSTGQSLFGADNGGISTSPTIVTDGLLTDNLRTLSEIPSLNKNSPLPPTPPTSRRVAEKIIAGALGGIASDIIYMRYIKDYMPINLLRRGHFRAMQGYIKALKKKTGLDSSIQQETVNLTEHDCNALDKEINELVELNKCASADYRDRLDQMKWYTKLARHQYAFIAGRQIQANILSVALTIVWDYKKAAWNNNAKDWQSLTKTPAKALMQETISSFLGTTWAITRDAKTWNKEIDEFALELKRIRDRVANLRSMAQLKAQNDRTIAQLSEQLKKLQVDLKDQAKTTLPISQTQPTPADVHAILATPNVQTAPAA